MTLAPLEQGDPPRVGRYRLTARLGAGGMGVVYLGEADDGQQVAVKTLRPEYTDDRETRARFRHEAKALARVRNRYTVRVLDADPGGSTPYLATEFADGLSLDEHVKTYGPLSPEAVITLAAGLAEALTAIHAADVTHRDLKPSNILLTSTGPLVIDFGIARTADATSITQTGMTIGSPAYMAPEQATGHAIRESDIFAWALVVAFAASGQPPFGTGPAIAVINRVLNDDPDISAVPPRLMPLVTSALAKDPAQRPPAADLVRELSSEPDITAVALAARPRRRRVLAAATALSAAAVLAAGAVLLADGVLNPGARAPAHADARPTTTGTARPSTGGRPVPHRHTHSVAENAVPEAQAAGPTKPRGVSVHASTPSASPSPVSSSPAYSSPVSSPSYSPSPVSSPSSSPSPVSSPSSSPSPSQAPSGSSSPAGSGPAGSGAAGSGSAGPSGSGSGSPSGSSG